MMKIMMIFGTRPEAIKMCPLYLEMKNHPEIECKICLTGQHRDMLLEVMKAFDIQPDYNLDVMMEGQTLTDITIRVMRGVESVFLSYTPQLVLVHGDTTTAFASAVASFYKKIPIGHVEAGLRTNDIKTPFPEEMNRRVIDQISSLCFAPTKLNRCNLESEGIENNVFVTGNTVIDSFKYTIKNNYVFKNSNLNRVNQSRLILVTAHRRENIGQGIRNICNAVRRISEEFKDIIIVFPVHPNPLVKETVSEILAGLENVLLIPPLDIIDMHNLLPKCYMVMTDSGGLQEEAPHFGKPVIVLRNETERQEAIDAGTVILAGTEEDSIYDMAVNLLNDREQYECMSQKINPYGDGHACERIVEKCVGYLMRIKAK